MANFNKPKDQVAVALENLVSEFETQSLSANKGHLFNDKRTVELLSMESAAISVNDQNELDNSMTQLEEVVRNVVSNESHVLGENLAPHQVKAGAIVAAASANTGKYMQDQTKINLSGPISTSMESLWDGAALDAGQISTESFDEKELNKFINYSIVFNVLASRQDEFNAAFFKPLTVTPDEVGYRIEMRIEQVWNGEEHDPTKVGPARFSKQPLIDALIHPEVLESNATDIIPAVMTFGTGGSATNNKAAFVDDTLVTPKKVKIDDVELLTAPLKIGKSHNLLKLSSIPELIANGLMDEKDSLDSRAALKTVYFKIGDTAVKWDVNSLMGTGFYKSPEGNFRGMALNFNSNGFLVTKDIRNVDGTENATLKPIYDAGYEVYFRVRLFGELRVDSGNVDLSAANVTVSHAFKDGVEVALDDATLKPLLAALKLEEDDTKIRVIGYDLETRRTNFNLRTRGRMIDSDVVSEQFVIPLRAPISIIKPIVGGDKENPDIKSLINAARIQANNDGVKTILNFAEVLKSVTSKSHYISAVDRDAIPGIGRHFLQPCYIEETLHLPDMINSVSSANRLPDIQGGISTKVNEILGRVLAITNYIPVVEQMTGGNPGQITAVIGTDQRLPQYFAIQGDERLFAGRVQHKVVSTANKYMRGKAIMTLTRDNSQEGPDPFSFGTFLWTSELMVSAQRTIGAATFQQHLVHPRYAHVVNTPIIVVLNITGIEEVTGEATVLNTRAVTAEDASYIGNGLPAPKHTDKDGKKPVTVTAPARP